MSKSLYSNMSKFPPVNISKKTQRSFNVCIDSNLVIKIRAIKNQMLTREDEYIEKGQKPWTYSILVENIISIFKNYFGYTMMQCFTKRSFRDNEALYFHLFIIYNDTMNKTCLWEEPSKWIIWENCRIYFFKL